MQTDEKQILPLQISSCISVELAAQPGFPERLPEQLERWNIQSIVVSENVLHNKLFQEAVKSGELKTFETHYHVHLDIKSYLADHPDLSGQILRKQIFSGTRYFVKQNTWSTDIFHFYAHKPEIIPLNAGKRKLRIPNPEHVFRLYFTASLPLDQNVRLRDITDSYNPKKHTVAAQSENGFLIVIRTFSLTETEELNRRFNYFDESHLKRVLKIFTTRFNSRLGVKGNLVFDLDRFINPRFTEEGVDYHESLDDSEQHLLTDIIRFWLAPSELFAAYGKAFNTYFQKTLKPILNSSAKQVLYRISISNPLLPFLYLDSATLLTIDENAFEPGTPFYTRSFIHLKRMVSRRLSEGTKKVPVSMHHLLNLHYSFSEKLQQFNHLLAAGVNHFYLKYDNTDDLAFKMHASDPSFSAYKNWFTRLHQAGHFFKEGIPLTEFLVLYPGLDDNLELFYRSMAQIHRSGLDYTLLDFDLFNSDKICSIDSGCLTFKEQTFKIILLPAIHVLSLQTLQKLAAFIENGGFIIAMGRVPERCAQPEHEASFMRISHVVWFEGNRTNSTSFKESRSGGASYFQADVSRFSNLIADFYKHLKVEIRSATNGIHYRLRETEHYYNLFLTNLNPSQTITFEFIGKLKGRPYIWDFSSAAVKPFANWYRSDEAVHIKMTLPPAQSEMLLINKLETNDIWQISQSSLEAMSIEEQSASALSFSGYQRKPGRSFIILKKGGESRQIPLYIPSKLPVLTISHRDWFLESEHFKGIVDLGNYARFFPFRSGSITYHKIIVLEKHYLKKQHLKLNLGNLKDWCTLFINEEFVADKYEAPWEFDISRFLKAGENKISITITNTIANRLARENDNYHVRDYGLYGPVKIVPAAQVSFKIEE